MIRIASVVEKPVSKNRNTAIEALRIIACLMVITIHTHLPALQEDGSMDINIVVIQWLVSYAVCIFWMISGCFIFDSELDYLKLLKKTFKRIVVPIVLISIICFYLGDFILGESLANSIRHSKKEYGDILRSLMLWRNPVNYLGHLWYLYTYLFIIVIFPILHSFVKYLDNHPNSVKWFLIISLTFFAINDCTTNQTFGFSNYGITAAVPAATEMIWGHIIFKYRKKICCKKGSTMVAAIVYIVLMLIRFILLLKQYYRGGEPHLLYWYVSFSIIYTSCLFIISFNTLNEVSNNRFNKVIGTVGASTFPIYLIHSLVYLSLYRLGFRELLLSYTVKIVPGVIGTILYTTCMSVTVFAIAFAIVTVWNLTKRSFLLLFRFDKISA